MYLVEGKNLDEIAKILEVSYDIVYRDMTNRLPKINENFCFCIDSHFFYVKRCFLLIRKRE